MPLSLLNHSALALFAQRTRIPTYARSIGFCAIWVCISSSSRNFPIVGEVRLTVLTRFRERAVRSFRTIDRVGPSKRDFTSQSEIIVWRIWVNQAQQFVCHLVQKPWRTIHVPSGRREITLQGRGTGSTHQRKPRSGTGRLFSAEWLRRRRGFMSPSRRRPRFLEPSRRRRGFLETSLGSGPRLLISKL